MHELEFYIDDQNIISHVEGYKNLFNDIMTLKTDGEMDFYVPIRSKNRIIWLSISVDMEYYKDSILYARINSIYKNKIPEYVNMFKRAHLDNLTGLFNRLTLGKHLKRIKDNNTSDILWSLF